MKKLFHLLLVVLALNTSLAEAQYTKSQITNRLSSLNMNNELAKEVASLLTGMSIQPNNTYNVARNAAGTANINVLKVDATDDTVLNADTGDVIKLSVAGTSEVQIDNDSLTFTGAAASIVGGATSLKVGSAGSTIISPANDAQRLFTFDSASDTALSLTWGDAGVTAVQILTLAPSTADADDDASLQLGFASGTRGAGITLPGEETAGGSDITYDAGTGDTHIFQVAGTTEATLADDSLLLSGAAAVFGTTGATSLALQVNSVSELTLTDNTLTFSGAIDSIVGGATSLTLGSAGSTILDARNDPQRLFTFNGSSDTIMTLNWGDGGTTASQTMTIASGNADADDDSLLYLSGGGAYALDGSRGAGLVLGGDQANNDAVLNAGLNSGGDVVVTAPASNGNFYVQTAGATKWTVDSTGTLIGGGTATIGWTVTSISANVACSTRCTTPAVMGFGLTTDSAFPVTGFFDGASASSDICLCAGAS